MIAGKGGLFLGHPRLPSSDSSGAAVSSPQMYAPGAAAVQVALHLPYFARRGRGAVEETFAAEDALVVRL
ncbi:MAG: hypothetical protein R3B46_10550 [Phycisphaerales bacterium]